MSIRNMKLSVSARYNTTMATMLAENLHVNCCFYPRYVGNVVVMKKKSQITAHLLRIKVTNEQVMPTFGYKFPRTYLFRGIMMNVYIWPSFISYFSLLSLHHTYHFCCLLNIGNTIHRARLKNSIWETDSKLFTLLIILTLLQKNIVFHNARILITFCKQNPCYYITLICLGHVMYIFVTSCIDERSNTTMKQY